MKETISKIACISTKLGKAPLELLEALTIPETERTEKLSALKKTLAALELVYLATCNRVEFIVVMPQADHDVAAIRNRILDFFFKTQDKDSKVNFEPDNFRLFSGREAVRHIFEVAASLDSIVIGEAQILGQIKDAHQFCQESALSGSVLERLFSAAYKAAKKVRTETELGQKPVSMASLVALRLSEIIGRNPEAGIAIIGSGAMTPKMAEIIRKRHDNPLYFVNRTTAKVEPFATKFNGKAVSLGDFLEGKQKVNIIISSTSSQEPIFTATGLKAIMADDKKIYAFDLAIPRDFASELFDSENLEIWNLERLNILAQKNRRDRFRTVDQASHLIEKQVKAYLKKEITQYISPLFDSAMNESMSLAQEGLNSLFKGKLSHLSTDDQELLLYWSKKVLARACYLPAQQLAENIANADLDQEIRLSYFVKSAR